LAAKAVWETVKEKSPTVPAAEELAFHVLVELDRAVARCWRPASVKPLVSELWKLERRFLISVRAEEAMEFVDCCVTMAVLGAPLTPISWSTTDFQSNPEANPDS